MLDRVLIRPDKAQESVAGITLQKHEREVPLVGTVVAVGPGQVNHNIKIDIKADADVETLVALKDLLDNYQKPIPTGLTPGDRVLYGRYSGTKVRHQGEEVLFIRLSDVLSILEEGDEER